MGPNDIITESEIDFRPRGKVPADRKNTAFSCPRCPQMPSNVAKVSNFEYISIHLLIADADIAITQADYKALLTRSTNHCDLTSACVLVQPDLEESPR